MTFSNVYMMNTILRKVFLAAIAVLILTGCRDDIFGTQNPRTQYNIYNWSQLFDAYWKGMNNNYAFWDIDPTDWDAVYDEYKPQFDALSSAGFSDSLTNVKAFGMFDEMTANLIDGHYKCTIQLPGMSSYIISPSWERIYSRPGYHESNATWWQQLYALQKMYAEKRLFIDPYYGNCPVNDTITLESNRYICGIIENDIVFLKFAQFTISAHLDTGDNVDSLFKYCYYHYLDSLPNIKGVIIDVRSNGGGYLNDLSLLLGKFVNEDHLVFYTRQKNGYDRLDYTPWIPEILEPTERNRELNVPIVVLADMNSVSMAEMTAMSILSMPNGCVIGERTHGGIGQLSNSNAAFDDYYGGYFLIPGPYNNPLMEVYTTMTMTKDINGNIYEGVGVPPTIEEPYDAQSLANGVDNQLERAIEYIRTRK